MRVVFVIYSLRCGGAQRVLATLANALAARGSAEITVATLDSAAGDFFTLDDRARRVALDLLAPARSPLAYLQRLWRRVAGLRAAVRSARADVVVSFIDQTNVLVLLATAGMRTPVVVAERTDPRRHSPGTLWRALRRLTYPRAAVVVVQNPDVRAWATRFIAPERVRVLPNPVLVPDSGAPLPAGLELPAQFIVGAGRLSAEKGFDLLLRAFAQLAPDWPRWQLVIVGDGPQRAGLQALARELGVAARVHWPGQLREIGGVFARAGVFALPSRYEGFPNALLEAMACGLPVVSFDCESGPRAIVADGVNGVLVPAADAAALARALAALLADPRRRRALGQQARTVAAEYDLGRVLSMWEAVLAEAARRR